MSSWISRATENRNAQLITTAVVSGAVVGSAILGFQKARRMYRVAEVKASIPEIDGEHHASRVSHVQLHHSGHGITTISLRKKVYAYSCSQLTEYGAASNIAPSSKEDQRSTELAARARKGDYDDGWPSYSLNPLSL